MKPPSDDPFASRTAALKQALADAAVDTVESHAEVLRLTAERDAAQERLNRSGEIYDQAKKAYREALLR